MCPSRSAATSTASTAANVACVAVAGATALCGINRTAECLTGENYGERILGSDVYDTFETITYTSAALISSAPDYYPYPSTGRTEPNSIKEQMKMHYAIQDKTKGKLINLTMRDSRMPAWMGWQKYSISGDGVDIHYVKHRVLQIRFDYKFK